MDWRERETVLENHRITVGELRERLSHYRDDCVVGFSTMGRKGGQEEIFGRLKSRDWDEENDCSRLVYIELNTVDDDQD